MATHTPDSPEAMAALSIEEEASITNEEFFGLIAQEVLKLSTSNLAILEQWLEHHGFDSFSDVFSTYYLDPNSIKEAQAMLMNMVIMMHFSSTSLPPSSP